MSLPATQTSDSPGADLLGRTIADRFALEEVIGDGAMGVVYRAKHLGLRKHVAVKVLHHDLTAKAQMVARFEREAAGASRLDHPNCVRIMDFGTTDDGRSFLVMELLEGEELAKRLPGPLPAFVVIDVIGQVLAALEHAHGHGLVHRDIKPENIFIVAGPEGEQVKILDFGIAKVQRTEDDKPLTQVGMVFGTPHYMSPEQAQGRTVDKRSDLYSVGVVMYEALTGDVPFPGEDAVAVLRGHIKQKPPAMPASVPEPLRRFVERLLAKSPDDRFTDAATAAAALKRASVGSEPPKTTAAGPRIPPPPSLGSGPKRLPQPGRRDHHPTTRDGLPTVDPGDPVTPPPPPANVAMPPLGTTTPPKPPTPPAPPPANAAGAASASGRPRWLNAAVVGGGLVLAIGIFAVTQRGDDDATDDATPASGEGEPASAAADAPADPTDAPDGAIAIDEDPPDEAAPTDDGMRGLEASLASVDALIEAKEIAAARIALEPFVERFPDSAALQWRMGHVLVELGAKRNGEEALGHLQRALELDPDLLDDDKFAADLWPLVDDPDLRVPATELAIAQLGGSAHERLASWVNVQRAPLPIATRRAAVAHLRAVDQGGTINDPLQVALDLWQAPQAEAPCEVYGEALKAAREHPDSFLWGSIAQAPVPHAAAEGEAEAPECPGLADAKAALSEDYAQRYAGLTPVVPAAFGKRKAAPSSSSSRRRSNRRRR